MKMYITILIAFAGPDEENIILFQAECIGRSKDSDHTA